MALDNNDPDEFNEYDGSDIFENFDMKLFNAHDNIDSEIESIVKASMEFDEPFNVRRIKLDDFLDNLKDTIDEMVRYYKEFYEIEKEVNQRLQEMDVSFYCNECGSDVETRVGIMKWNDDDEPATLQEWELMEKVNSLLEIPVRTVKMCTNRACRKIWKEDQFKKEIVYPQIQSIRNYLTKEIEKNRKTG